MEPEEPAGSDDNGRERGDVLPFSSVTDATFELEVFVELCWAGMAYAEVAGRIASVVDDVTKRGEDLKAQRQERAEKLEAFAKAQKPGFPYLYQLAVSRLWSILEHHVQDVFIYIVQTYPAVRELPSIKDLKGPVVEFAEASKDKQAELLFALVSNKLGAPLKVGVGRFEEILSAIDLGGPVDPSVRKLLLEVSEIRNVVMHRRGITDHRLVSSCPWAGLVVGKPVRISRTRFEGYILAAHWYAVELLRRRTDRYPPTETEAETGGYGTAEARLSLLSDLARVAEDRLSGPVGGNLGGG